jgi:hypothetical protein
MTEDERHAVLDECFDLNHAIQPVSQQPGFKYGLGPIEIRPVAEISEMMNESEQRRLSS